jgi:hypothetical protein
MNGEAAVASFRTAATSPASADGSRTSTTGNGSSDDERVSHDGGRSARLNAYVVPSTRPVSFHEGLRIWKACKRSRNDLEHAVGRVFVEAGAVERDDGRGPGPFHVSTERRAHERQRLVGTALEQQVGAAPPLARGHVAEPHERHGRPEHHDNERHHGRETDGAVARAPLAERQTPPYPPEGNRHGDRPAHRSLGGGGLVRRSLGGGGLDHRRISRSR